jgi:YgiT-type zinc finger domain-containing protein
MKCLHCKGEMGRGTAPYHVDRNGYHLTFDKVPAWVCTQCGEAYFEEAEVTEIQKAIGSVDREAAKVLAPVA